MKRRRTILVVEDDRDLRETVSEVLTEEGFQVVTAEDGHHALALLERHGPPDLILLDLMMPGMNGWQFLKAADDDQLRVIIMTAATEAAPEGLPVLRKPVRLSTLLSTIERHLAN